MSRWIWLFVCALLGLGMVVCGLLVPAHLRAVDVGVLQMAGRSTPVLPEQGQELVNDNHLGAASLLAQAAETQGIRDHAQLALAVQSLARQHPDWQVWGGPEPRFESLFVFSSSAHNLPQAFTEFMVRAETREKVIGYLSASHRPAVRALLGVRSLTKTAIFDPSGSASGQALDTAVGLCGLLLEEDHLSSGLSNAVYATAVEANRSGKSQPLEQILLDLMSLGQRFNWGQLVAFVTPIEDPESLRLLGNFVRRAEGQLPVLFSAVLLSDNPGAVAHYLRTFGQTGMSDLGTSLRYGAGGLDELLRRNQRLYTSGPDRYVALGLCWQMPQLALGVKWFFYLAGGFLLALAAHFAWRPVSALEQPLQVRGFHIAREVLFALGFLLVVLLLSEPFLSQESQKVDFTVHLRLPTVGKVGPAVTQAPASLMNQLNQLNLLTLLLFFVLQALLYTACLFKLAEIRRQRVPARIKLRLLENEDHLFDAGLYLGFVGTVISLILFSLGVIKFSLMAAYSSTSFGIIFVSIFKIFHLRPARRKFLLEAEVPTPEPVAPTGSARLATPS